MKKKIGANQWKHFYLIGSHPLPGVQWIDSNYRFTLSTCTTNVGLASSAHHNNPEDNQHTSNTAPTSNTAVSSNHSQIQYGSAYTSGQMIASNKQTLLAYLDISCFFLDVSFNFLRQMWSLIQLANWSISKLHPFLRQAFFSHWT